MTRLLRLDKTTANLTKDGGGGGTSGDIRQIFPNIIDTTPSINMIGAGNYELSLPTGLKFRVKDAATGFFEMWLSGTDAILEAHTSGHNIFLMTNGTGKVKFGTHAATGDVVSDGNIPIIDSGGNARKLMTTA